MAAGGGRGAVPVRVEGDHPPGKQVWTIWRAPFELDVRYEPIKPIGKGAYGVVCSAKDATTGEKCAIKKINSAFDNPTDARRTLREIMILQHLGTHENIICLKDIMRPAPREGFEDVYLVYELMDTDLHQIIRSSQPLSDDHVQYFIYQILRGLKYIHSASILHRDLKPSNLLLNATCDLKICDFGLSRSQDETKFMTEYVVTRWYRAPELLLSCDEYSTGIDMWSVGCIFAELMQRKPLFEGKDYIDQLKQIVRILGSPPEDDLQFIQSQKARAYIRSLPYTRGANFTQLFPKANPLAIDLCERMLCFNPRSRISVEEALQHPYLASLHDVNSEPSCMAEFKTDFEDQDLDKDALASLVWKEMEKVRRPGPARRAVTPPGRAMAQRHRPPGHRLTDRRPWPVGSRSSTPARAPCSHDRLGGGRGGVRPSDAAWVLLFLRKSKLGKRAGGRSTAGHVRPRPQKRNWKLSTILLRRSSIFFHRRWLAPVVRV